MEFRILGPLEAREGEEFLPLGPQKQRALLAVLLLNANRTVSFDHLVEELWGVRPPDSAAKVVQTQFLSARDWPSGASLGFLLMLVTIVGTLVSLRILRREVL